MVAGDKTFKSMDFLIVRKFGNLGLDKDFSLEIKLILG